MGDRWSATTYRDLEESIQFSREVVEATPEDHPDRSMCLNNFGIGLRDRYMRSGAMAAHEESIQFSREAIETTPEDHPDRSVYLNSLGIGLRDRYSRTGAMTDLDDSEYIALSSWSSYCSMPRASIFRLAREMSTSPRTPVEDVMRSKARLFLV